jgi:hypothetical protein
MFAVAKIMQKVEVAGLVGTPWRRRSTPLSAQHPWLPHSQKFPNFALHLKRHQQGHQTGVLNK